MTRAGTLKVRFELGAWDNLNKRCTYEAIREFHYADGGKGGDLCDRIKIERAEDGQWEASYMGDPYSIAHPETRTVNTQSCTCPKVKVPGTYRTRELAARAGWTHKLATGGYVSHYTGKYEGPPPSHLPTL